ncbi:hypothetical protein SAMD00019534_106660, partial [Acytostelium subglobosum LB1]|uniref:hypothetical protein n=1 Tax=Acytostelium subglobosum LB1 TaxID=1410327 RepID=UPI0006449222
IIIIIIRISVQNTDSSSSCNSQEYPPPTIQIDQVAITYIIFSTDLWIYTFRSYWSRSTHSTQTQTYTFTHTVIIIIPVPALSITPSINQSINQCI